MKRKIFLTLAICLISSLLMIAFAIDCWAQLTLDVNAAVAELESDTAYCDEYADFASHWCYTEANMSFNYNIDQALAAFDRCDH